MSQYITLEMERINYLSYHHSSFSHYKLTVSDSIYQIKLIYLDIIILTNSS